MPNDPSIIRFTKMHGIGNDYLYINVFEDGPPPGLDDPHRWPAIIRAMSDRHFGIGSDGVILVMPPDSNAASSNDTSGGAHVRMRMFNADASESEMCGNGIRCVCKLAHDRGICRENPMRIQTGRGVLELKYTKGADGLVDGATVDMGEPIWESQKIPVDECDLGLLFTELGEDCHELLESEWNWVSMGNPHIVFFTRDVARIPLEKWGPIIECYRAFPKRINAHFVQVHSPVEVTMRTWERGSGVTLACGTGAAAVCAACVASKDTERELLVRLPGGELILRWDEKTDHIFMTGPATEICTGEWRIPR